MATLIENFLTELKSAGSVCEFYRDALNTDSFRAIPVFWNSRFLQLVKVSDSLEYDGGTIFPMADITRISSGNREYSLLSRKHKAGAAVSSSKNHCRESMAEVLETLQETYGYVAIHPEYVDTSIYFIGRLLDHDDAYVRMSTYGTIKSQDRGEFVLRLGDIARADFDSPYENLINRLKDDWS
jgi:hypothetical protein